MKRRLAVAAVLAAAVLIAGCCPCGFGKKKAPAPAKPTAAPKIARVFYKSWIETVDADLAKLTLNRSRTEYKYASPVSGNPISSKTTSQPEKKLEPAQAQAIAAFVLASGFLDLKGAYGAPEGQRYYPYEITVHLEGGKPKHVLFRSNPSYEGMPEPFKKLEAFLKRLPESASKKAE